MPAFRTLLLCLALSLTAACAISKSGGVGSVRDDAHSLMVPPAPRSMPSTAHSLAYDAETDNRASPSGQAVQRHLVHTARLKIEVTSLESANREVDQLIEDFGGYAESKITRELLSTMTLRIPAVSRLEALEAFRGLGKVLHQELQSEEVTDQVIDLRAELASQIALRDRLRALLDRAQNVGEVLSIEREIQRLQASINANQSRLDALLQLVAMAKIDLSLTQYVEPEEKPSRILGPLGLVVEGSAWLIRKLYVIRE